MQCHKPDFGEFGCSGDRPRYGVRYVMKFQIEEDAETMSGKRLNGLWAFGSEELAPDLK